MRVGIVCVVMLGASAVRADVRKSTEEAEPPESRQLVYVELLGKAGPYGVGYEHAITPRLSLGGVASYAPMRGQQITTVSPYLHARLLGHRKHSLFAELGAVLVHSRIPSPVPEWDGASDTGGGGVAAIGWQRTGRRVVVRAQGSVLVGEGGAAPWTGFAIGFRP
jgi:hypothetical protein